MTALRIIAILALVAILLAAIAQRQKAQEQEQKELEARMNHKRRIEQFKRVAQWSRELGE